jgi:hypothetical protein
MPVRRELGARVEFAKRAMGKAGEIRTQQRAALLRGLHYR